MSAYRVEWPAWADWYAASTTPTRTQASGFIGGGVLTVGQAGVDGGYAEWQVATASGTFTLFALYTTDNYVAKFQMSIDGANVGALTDGYTAGAVHNNIYSATGLTLTEGVHTIRISVNGKNASSSGYRVPVAWFSLERTGA